MKNKNYISPKNKGEEREREGGREGESVTAFKSFVEV